MGKKRGSNHFNEQWLTMEKFKGWLARSKQSSASAHCKLCNKDFSIANAGKSEVYSHAGGKSHKSRLTAASSSDVTTFKNPNKESQPSTSNTSASSTSNSSELSVPLDVVHAEIRWALKVVESGFSYRSCLDLNDLFKVMFGQNSVAQNFRMSKTKCSYLINFGLGLHFTDNLVKDIKNSPFFSVAFDESLNKISQSQQMDVNIRFWRDGVVHSRYFDSQFMLRGNKENICEAILNSIQQLDQSKMNHLSMDGPNTNWAVLKLLDAQRIHSEYPELAKIGSCSLHIVCGCLKTAFEKSTWGLGKIMKAMWKFFQDSPARRDIYLRSAVDSQFPLMFCATRWVHNESVAEVAVAVWDNVVYVTRHYMSLAKSKRPKNNKSYETLTSSVNDSLMKIKFTFFKELASLLNTFLVPFQSDKAMLPFLSGSLFKLVKRILKMFLLRKTVESIDTYKKIATLDVENKDTYLPLQSMKLPTAVINLINSSSVSNAMKDDFRRQCQVILVTLISKFQERNPLASVIVRNADALSPNLIASDKETVVAHFEILVRKISVFKAVSHKVADNAKAEYDDFLDNVVPKHRDKFSSFCYLTDRVDEFLGQHLNGNQKYANLWTICIYIFVVSHGQASVERGFNINKEMLVENMKEISLVRLRMVYDALETSGFKCHNFPISNGLLVGCRQACSRYKLELEKNKCSEVQKSKQDKRKLKEDEMTTVKRQRLATEVAMQCLDKDSEKLYLEAEQKNQLDLLIMANALKKTSKEKRETLKDLDVTLDKLKEELKQI